MDFLIFLFINLLDIYLWLIIVAIVAGWLVAFDVLNTKNQTVYKVYSFLNRVTVESPPFLKLRRYIPPLGGIDISPMVAIFGIYILQRLLLGLV
jgi:YggT family protein